MKRMGGIKNEGSLRCIHCALLILPAVALGACAMAHAGASPVRWGQQVAAWALLALALPLIRRAVRRAAPDVWALLLLLGLAASLLGEAAGGARRWVNLGIFHANAAMLVLPALLVVLNRVKHSYPMLLAAAAILSVQPDFAQLAAFCAAVLPVLILQWKEKRFVPVCVFLLAVFMVWCVRIPTALEPLDDCEGILRLMGNLSPLLAACGCLALAAVPAFWLTGFLKSTDRSMLSLFVYYAVMMLFAFLGGDPVPFSGFGLSPIAGYYLACAFVMEKQKTGMQN